LYELAIILAIDYLELVVGYIIKLVLSGRKKESLSRFPRVRFPELLNGVFFLQKFFYRKVTLKIHMNPFLKFKIDNTKLIIR
jgi:hypothetical protein